MSIVTLVSGGLDSTLMSLLINEEKVQQYPLFIDYGQLCEKQEWSTCLDIHKKYKLPRPKKMNINGFGKVISSGLTTPKKRLNEDAFLPGRNLLFLIVASAYAIETQSNAVAIGLLDDKYHLFPDQTQEFVSEAKKIINIGLGHKVDVLTPLIKFSKIDIIKIAKKKKIKGTYSCHSGNKKPCGVCVSCFEKKKALHLIKRG